MSPTQSNAFDFNGLFTLDIANNHQGSLEHGLNIIRQHAASAKKNGVRAAIKFQFRDLKTFVHPHYRGDTTNKHVSRFLSTELSKEDFTKLVDAVKEEGLVTMCTPFDEISVDFIKELDIDVIKVASCSAKDWPLLEKISKAGKPVIVSTGGLTIADIDKIVSFCTHRYLHFALMHCVSIYPTPTELLELNQIDILKKRYPDVTIGFSTHEVPANYTAIQIAYAKGATIFERHIGIRTDTIKLNAYSSMPDEIDKWMQAYWEAVRSCGAIIRMPAHPDEERDLRSLMRGAFVSRDIKKGEIVAAEDIFFAIPIQKGQLSSGEFRAGVIAEKDHSSHSALPIELKDSKKTAKDIVYSAIHAVRGMLNEARIPINHEYGVELSHHYGIENFANTGIVIIDCVNREYCKKIIVQLPGQEHPSHFHVKKEEAFHVLSGTLEIELEGKKKTLYPGDVQIVSRGVKHRFWSESGVIFEEVSTTHHNDDSFYEDATINEMGRDKRKTKLVNWGRHQFQ